MSYTPYSTFGAPFSIGLNPVDPNDFLHVDDELSRYLDEKRALYASDFDAVCRAEEGTVDAQQEVLDLIKRQLTIHCSANLLNDGPASDRADPNAHTYPLMPIATAGLLVQDDLVLMRRNESGWRLVACSLCFPSSWHLGDKFSKPLELIHKPVPGMEGRMSAMINRIFDNLNPNIPVWRENWSLDGDGDLRHDRPESHRVDKREKLAGTVFARTEYQTLHKLPVSGDILFTIHIYSRSLPELKKHKRSKDLFAQLLNQYEVMSDAQKGYKGILKNAEKLTDWLATHSQ